MLLDGPFLKFFIPPEILVRERPAFTKLHGQLGDAGLLTFLTGLDRPADVFNLAGSFADELNQTVFVFSELDDELAIPLPFRSIELSKFGQSRLQRFNAILENMTLPAQILNLGLQTRLFEQELIPLGGQDFDLIATETANPLKASGFAGFRLFPGGNINNHRR